MSYSTVTGHRSMALDAVRNAAYGRALAQVITPDSVVLDVGAGTGIHGLMAARLGARRVYLVEPEDVIAVAEENVRANGLEGRVFCVQGRIEDVILPEQVDVIVSVLTGNFLLAEDLLPALFHARDAMLKPGGTLIPSVARMEAVPISASALHLADVASWSEPQEGVTLSPGRAYAANTVFYRTDTLRSATWLAEPAVLHTVDLAKDSYQAVSAAAEFEVSESGTCHGFAGWFAIKLGDEWLSTSTRSAVVHWKSAYLPLDPPIELVRGQRLGLTLRRTAGGDWMWTAVTASTEQSHSTMLSVPMTARTIGQASAAYSPKLNTDGRAMQFVLSHCDGKATVNAIGEQLHRAEPGRFEDLAAAVRFVQRVIRQYA